jgi:hypothetical protein
MILLHETYQVVPGALDDFERIYWDAVDSEVDRLDGVAPLWLLRQRQGIEGELVIALTAVRSGSALGGYTAWRQGKGGAAARRLAGELSRRCDRKALLAAPWSTLREWDEIAEVAATPAGDGPRIFMEDTGWPYSVVSEYVDYQRRDYFEPLQQWAKSGHALLKLWGFFLVAPGTGRRPEAVFLQEVLDARALERLIGEPEVYDPDTFPGSYMVRGLLYRDQWRSRLLVASKRPT